MRQIGPPPNKGRDWAERLPLKSFTILLRTIRLDLLVFAG